MLVIVMTVCALSAPYGCTDHRLQFVDAGTPTFCMIAAMPHLAEWTDEHPGYRVARWRCVYVADEGTPA